MHHLRSQLAQKLGGVSAPLAAALKLQRFMSNSHESPQGAPWHISAWGFWMISFHSPSPKH